MERAFSMLKSQWQIVLKKIEQQTQMLTKTVVASCVLHNICIERGDFYDDDCYSDDDSDDEDEDRIVFETGPDVRDALKDFVWENL